MKKENKELLLKDLCARLPYGVICNTPEGDGHLCSIIQTIFGTEYGINIKATERDYFNDKEVCIKPYLRPMSSMTEEEKIYIDHKFGADNYGNITIYSSYEGGASEIELADIVGFQDWLNKNMFDYRGLIPMGLAIEVTEQNNPYKD